MNFSRYPLIFSIGLLLFSCFQKKVIKRTNSVFIEKNKEGYQLIRNGSPYFIKGGSGSEFLLELKKVGGNTVRVYDTINLKASLDRIDSLGLTAIIDIHLPRYKREKDTFYTNSQHTANLKVNLKKFVRKYKDHPALLYWMLGNEVYYPKLFNNEFVKVYNDLLRLVHRVDPNHPVSTTVSSSGLRKVPSILMKSSELDFLSINDFGALHDFELDKDILFFWTKPYVISEWGIHGPWEANLTDWAAPIEINSTEKARRHRQGYRDYIQSINDGRHLGSLIFYWGQKQERTHTWFSLFNREGKRTQSVFEIENLWSDHHAEFNGVQIENMTLNGKEANENIILVPNQENQANLSFSKNFLGSDWMINWEIKPENWNIFPHDIEKEPASIQGLIQANGEQELLFTSPASEGPYRIFVEIEDQNGYVATANIPFYVINVNDEKEVL